jgi:hypothetical protein
VAVRRWSQAVALGDALVMERLEDVESFAAEQMLLVWSEEAACPVESCLCFQEWVGFGQAGDRQKSEL